MGMIKIRRGKFCSLGKRLHPYPRLMSYLKNINIFDAYTKNAKEAAVGDLSGEDRQDRSCREILITSFFFDRTPEGWDYWSDIAEKVSKNLDHDRY